MPTTLLAECLLPTTFGPFQMLVFGDRAGGEDVVALVHGTAGIDPPLVRLQSACFTGDLLGSLRCDCGQQLRVALQMIVREQHGILLYLLRHEGRGIGLANKIKAYALQEQGLDTVEANTRLGLPADARDYAAAAATLEHLGVRHLRLATNNPLKIRALTEAGLLVNRVPHGGFVNPHNEGYLRTKDLLMGHLNSAGVPDGQYQ